VHLRISKNHSRQYTKFNDWAESFRPIISWAAIVKFDAPID